MQKLNSNISVHRLQKQTFSSFGNSLYVESVQHRAIKMSAGCHNDGKVLQKKRKEKKYHQASFAASQALVYNSGNVNLVIFSSLSSNGICYLPKTHQM